MSEIKFHLLSRFKSFFSGLREVSPLLLLRDVDAIGWWGSLFLLAVLIPATGPRISALWYLLHGIFLYRVAPKVQRALKPPMELLLGLYFILLLLDL
ncbi:MAG: hypothetical protein D6814_00580, partial [Calditrichaeota bacterium]